MMVKRNTSILGIGLVLSLVLCSCSGNAVNETQQTEADSMSHMQTYSFPKEYSAEGENVELDMVVEAPDPSYFIKGKATPQKLDYEGIGRELIPDEEAGEMDPGTQAIVTKETVGDKGFYKKLFMWGGEGGTYQTYQYSEIYGSLREDERDSAYNLYKYAEEREFSFGTAGEGLDIVMEELKNLGIALEDPEVDTYYLDFETMKEEEEHYDIDGNKEVDKYKQDWTEQDNYYLYYIHQTYSGMRDYHKGDYGPNNAQKSNAQIAVIYGEPGIIYLNIADLYSYESDGQEESLLEFNEIADLLLKHYDNLLDDSEYQVVSARLCCDFQRNEGITVEREIRPVWAFSIVETQADGYITKYEIRIDAANGKMR